MAFKMLLNSVLAKTIMLSTGGLHVLDGAEALVMTIGVGFQKPNSVLLQIYIAQTVVTMFS